MTATNSLTTAIINYLNASHHFAWRNNTTGVYDPTKKIFRKHHGLKGIADILGIHRDTGKIICIEVKTGKDKMSEWQKSFQSEINNRGGIYIIAKKLDDVINNDLLK